MTRVQAAPMISVATNYFQFQTNEFDNGVANLLKMPSGNPRWKLPSCIKILRIIHGFVHKLLPNTAISLFYTEHESKLPYFGTEPTPVIAILLDISIADYSS